MRRSTIALLSTLVLAGCGGGDEPPAVEPRLSDDDATLALGIYTDQGCAVCHGDRAQGNDLGPALRELSPYFDEARLALYLKDPDGFVAANPDFAERRDSDYGMPMPAYDGLEVFDRRLLARWLLTR